MTRIAFALLFAFVPALAASSSEPTSSRPNPSRPARMPEMPRRPSLRPSALPQPPQPVPDRMGLADVGQELKEYLLRLAGLSGPSLEDLARERHEAEAIAARQRFLAKQERTRWIRYNNAIAKRAIAEDLARGWQQVSAEHEARDRATRDHLYRAMTRGPVYGRP